MSLEEKLYEEIGANYRFFLNWRHAGLAAHIFLAGATLSLCIKSVGTHDFVLWIGSIFFCLFSLLCLALDYRTRKVFQCAIAAGRKMEEEKGGYFTELKNIGVIPGRDNYISRITHTNIITIYYIASSVISAFCFIIFAFGIVDP